MKHHLKSGIAGAALAAFVALFAPIDAFAGPTGVAKPALVSLQFPVQPAYWRHYGRHYYRHHYYRHYRYHRHYRHYRHYRYGYDPGAAAFLGAVMGMMSYPYYYGGYYPDYGYGYGYGYPYYGGGYGGFRHHGWGGRGFGGHGFAGRSFGGFHGGGGFPRRIWRTAPVRLHTIETTKASS